MIALALRYWPQLIAALAVVVVVGWFWAWIAGKDEALARSQRQQAATVTWAGALQRNWMIETGNRARVQGALNTQNAAISSLGEQSRIARQTASEQLRRAQQAHARDPERVVVLRAPLVAPDRCTRADEAARRVREALG